MYSAHHDSKLQPTFPPIDLIPQTYVTRSVSLINYHIVWTKEIKFCLCSLININRTAVFLNIFITR